MTMRDQVSVDLERLGADRVKAALDSVYQLTDDPGTLLRIALFAASVPIGGAAGFVAGIAEKAGKSVPYKEAHNQILDLLKVLASDGPERVTAFLKASTQ